MNPDPADELCAYGPIVTVQFAAATSSGVSVSAGLLVDTGAEVTVIDEALAASLGTVAVRSMDICGVTSTEPTSMPVHTVIMSFPSLGLSRQFEIDVVVLPRAEDDVPGLIGRDVLRHLRLTYDGPAGSFTLTG